MKEEIIGKVNKLGKAGVIVTKISSVIVWIAFVMCSLMLIAAIVLPKEALSVTLMQRASIDINLSKFVDSLDIVMEYDEDVEIDDISYKVEDLEQEGAQLKAEAQSETFTFTLKDMIWILAAALLVLIAMVIALRYIEKLCKLFQKCETPFAGEIADAIKKVAFSLIPFAVFSQFKDIGIDNIANGEWDLTLGVDLMAVILILFVFLLSAIFRYGAELQQESDETL